MINFVATVSQGIDYLGIVCVILGSIYSLLRYLVPLFKSEEGAYSGLRKSLGRAVLLSLEFFVAADIIKTVMIEPDLKNVAVLAGIVIIRTFLSFSIEVELDGTWPWRRGTPR